MSSLIEKIKAGADHVGTIQWPGTDEPVGLRLLTEFDYSEAGIAADRHFKDIAIGAQNVNNYNAEIETQWLFRAVVNPDTKERLFNNIVQFKKMLTPEIKDILAEKLSEMQEKYNPNPDNMTEDEFDKFLDNVKKNPRETVGNIQSISLARRVIISLASPPTNSQTDSSSTS